jgi:hypothetical protein
LEPTNPATVHARDVIDQASVALATENAVATGDEAVQQENGRENIPESQGGEVVSENENEDGEDDEGVKDNQDNQDDSEADGSENGNLEEDSNQESGSEHEGAFYNGKTSIPAVCEIDCGVIPAEYGFCYLMESRGCGVRACTWCHGHRIRGEGEMVHDAPACHDAPVPQQDIAA